MKQFLIVLLTSTLAAAAAPRSFTGVITDSMCVRDHKAMNVSPDEKCVRECARSGNVKYVLLDGKTVYKLSDQSTPAQFAAQRVKVTGTLYEKTGVIQVEKIERAR